MFIYFMKVLLRSIERKFTVSSIPILIFIYVTKEVVSLYFYIPPVLRNCKLRVLRLYTTVEEVSKCGERQPSAR